MTWVLPKHREVLTLSSPPALHPPERLEDTRKGGDDGCGGRAHTLGLQQPWSQAELRNGKRWDPGHRVGAGWSSTG